MIFWAKKKQLKLNQNQMFCLGMGDILSFAIYR